MRGKQHPRSTDPALRGAVLDECLLKSRQPFAVSKPFHRENTASFDLTDRHQAAIHHLAVDQHGAGAAFPFTAPFFCAGETEVLSQNVEQTTRTSDIERHGCAV